MGARTGRAPSAGEADLTMAEDGGQSAHTYTVGMTGANGRDTGGCPTATQDMNHECVTVTALRPMPRMARERHSNDAKGAARLPMTMPHESVTVTSLRAQPGFL